MTYAEHKAYTRALEFLCLAEIPCEGMFHAERKGRIEVVVITTPEAMADLGGYTVEVSDTHGPGYLDISATSDACGMRFQCTATDERWAEATETATAPGRVGSIPAAAGSEPADTITRFPGEGSDGVCGLTPLGRQ